MISAIRRCFEFCSAVARRGQYVADERMLTISDNDSILHVGRKDCVPWVELRRRLFLTSIPALLMQRRLRWFGHAARRPIGELIKALLLPTSPRI